MALSIPADPKEKARILRELFSTPSLLPENFLSYLNDYNAVNQAAVPISQVIGSQGFLERLDANTTDVSWSNSTADTSIYSYDVPAGLLQTNGAIRVDISGKYLNNSAADRTFSLQVKYGATTMWQDTSTVIPTGTGTRAVNIWVILSANNSTTAQKLIGNITVGDKNVPNSGFGSFDGQAGTFPFGGTASQDSGLKKTLDFIITMQNNTATQTWTKNVAYTVRVAH